MKYEKDKITVIIPVYNVENYLERCLKSILYNTYTNLEIICVNDGSTDNSKKILEDYSKRDKRVVVINKKNAGVSSASAVYDAQRSPFCFRTAVFRSQRPPIFS